MEVVSARKGSQFGQKMEKNVSLNKKKKMRFAPVEGSFLNVDQKPIILFIRRIRLF